MSAAAIIVIRQNRWIQRFRELGATSVETAIERSEIPGSGSWIFNRMVSRGVFILTPGGKLYMDEERVSEFVRSRKSKMLVCLVVGGLIIALLFLILGYGS